MKEIKKKLWAVKEEDGNLLFFNKRPTYDKEDGVWCGEEAMLLYDDDVDCDLQWYNSPVEVEMVIRPWNFVERDENYWKSKVHQIQDKCKHDWELTYSSSVTLMDYYKCRICGETKSERMDID